MNYYSAFLKKNQMTELATFLCQLLKKKIVHCFGLQVTAKKLFMR